MFQFRECAKIETTVAWKNCGTNVTAAGLSSGTPSDTVLLHGLPTVPLCNAIISSNQQLQQHQMVFAFNQGPPSVDQNMSVIVALNEVYLINHIKIEPYPNDDQVNTLGFSYTLEVSTNATNWKMLLDYSKYTCYGRQTLRLPTIAVRCVSLRICYNITLFFINFFQVFSVQTLQSERYH